jgi:hypothetical protein
MTRAVVPMAFPVLPEGATEWRRSLRQGSMYHAHVLGRPVCGARVDLVRHRSEAGYELGGLMYWGCCPRCVAKGIRDAGRK